MAASLLDLWIRILNCVKFFSLLLFLIYFFHATGSSEVQGDIYLSQNVQIQIERIPQKERLFLEKFFDKLIRTDGLGYVLFGSKPVCLSGYFINPPLGNLLMRFDNFSIKRGWEVWNKYEHLFPHPNYLILEEAHVRGDDNIHPIYFISRKNLLKTISANSGIFENELSIDLNAEKFLSEINKKQSLSEVINFHEGLLGILLGYGAESSMHYYRRDLMWKFKPPLLCEEVYLESVSVYPDNAQSIFEDIHPIQFVGKPRSQEVKSILEQNSKERSYLLNIYSQGNLLEITLRKLTESAT